MYGKHKSLLIQGCKTKLLDEDSFAAATAVAVEVEFAAMSFAVLEFNSTPTGSRSESSRKRLCVGRVVKSAFIQPGRDVTGQEAFNLMQRREFLFF